MAADKIIRNSKLDTFLSKLATKLTAIFWRKAETTQVSIDDTPTASSNNLVKSGGVYTAVNAKYTKPVNGIPASDIESGVIPDAVEANPTVPSGTTPTTLANLKVGSGYYAVPQGGGTTLSTDVETDKNDNSKASTPKSVYDFVGNPIVSLAVPSTPDGTVIATHRNGDTDTIDLNHQHLDYPKYYLCTDETEYAGITTKDSGTLYLIPES